MIDIFNVKENKITTNLLSYPIVLLSESTGDGKTYTMLKMLESISPEGKKPLFLMFEDRYQHIPNIKVVRIHNIPELEQVKNQLKTPKAKELYSCVVFDTADKLDSMMEKYIAVNKEVEITGDLNFGKGNKYIKNKLFIIDELRNDGWSVQFCGQSIKSTNIVTQETTFEPALNKETWKKLSHDAYLIGMLTVEGKNKERYITFEKSSKYPSLKDSLGMPRKIKVSDFKDELNKAIHSIKGADFTDEDTINNSIVEEFTFEQLKEKGNNLGAILADNGKLEEVFNILRTNIGIADEKTNQPKMFNDLLPTQRDLAELVIIKLEELCSKYNIN